MVDVGSGGDVVGTVDEEAPAGRHRQHRFPARSHALKVLYGDDELAAVQQAAALSGLRPSSYVAAAALAMARQVAVDEPVATAAPRPAGRASVALTSARDRELLAELMRSRVAVRRGAAPRQQRARVAVLPVHLGTGRPEGPGEPPPRPAGDRQLDGSPQQLQPPVCGGKRDFAALASRLTEPLLALEMTAAERKKPMPVFHLTVAAAKDPETGELIDRYLSDEQWADIAGEYMRLGAVRRAGGIPPYPETQHYIGRVRALTANYADPGRTTCGAGPPGSRARPITGPITSGFGPRWGRLHAGVDSGAPIGTAVYAASNGTVLAADPASGYGQGTSKTPQPTGKTRPPRHTPPGKTSGKTARGRSRP